MPNESSYRCHRDPIVFSSCLSLACKHTFHFSFFFMFDASIIVHALAHALRVLHSFLCGWWPTYTDNCWLYRYFHIFTYRYTRPLPPDTTFLSPIQTPSLRHLSLHVALALQGSHHTYFKVLVRYSYKLLDTSFILCFPFQLLYLTSLRYTML